MSDDSGIFIPSELSKWFSAVVAGSALMAFFIQPLLRFMNPVNLIEGAFLLAASFTLYPSFARWKRGSIFDTILVAWGLGVGMWGLFTIYSEILDAKLASKQNDLHCLVIEREMIRGNPRRDDLPDLFQAFGCRLQSKEITKRAVK